MDLQQVPVEALLQALLDRSDELFRKDGPPGLLISLAYQLRVKLGAVACTDGIACRYRPDGTVELMAIRRKTGPFAGKLCFVGGLIAKGEHIEAAIRRHFKADLGVDIAPPQFAFHSEQGSVLHQNAPEEWWNEPTKDHNIGLTFIVKLLSEDFSFGATAHGGQEADKVVWFSEADMPPDDEFGYSMDRGYKKAFMLLKRG